MDIGPAYLQKINILVCILIHSGYHRGGGIHDLIIRNLKNVIFNKRLLQNPESEACGYYCILMLKNLDARISLAEAMSQFSDDVIENDKKVISQIRRLISVLKV